MAGKLEGKVAFITGAARGQGRSHAIRLAQEGANIIAVDICSQIDTVPYPMSTPDDLAQTVKEVEALDRRIVATQADVRDEAALKSAFEAGVAELGPADIVLANAGIAPMSVHEPHDAWQDVINVNLTGVFNTVETAIPSMTERGQGGAIVLTSSTAGINGIGGPTRGGPGLHGRQARRRRADALLRQHPGPAPHPGELGIAKTMANELAAHKIRVNTVHPTGVDTPMGTGLGGLEPLLTRDPNLGPIYMNTLPVEIVDPRDISNAVLFLASDEARYVTGLEFTVDAGNTIR